MKPIRFLPKIQRGKECLNCGLPLQGEENFCPNCGQRNDVRKLNFGNFLSTIFSEFISYDSKFWRTIFILILKPGKVSKDYINGKRAQYVNPFRFYLTVSIIFFLLLSLYNKYDALKNSGETKKTTKVEKAQIATNKKKGEEKAFQILDSIKKANPKDKDLQSLNNQEFNVDSLGFSKKNKGIAKKLIKYNGFYKNHKSLSVEAALDSMGDLHSFWNRFYYTKTGDAYKVLENKGADLNKKIISNLSIALFIFLPLFTLFLKLFYIRGSLNYMEHLIFVFNTQAVFFLLMILLLSINFFTQNESIATIFIVLFLIYLYMSLLKFYNQGWFKTLIKFSIFNWIYLTLSGIGLVIVSVLAFLIG